jgi:hypothetical protein
MSKVETLNRFGGILGGLAVVVGLALYYGSMAGIWIPIQIFTGLAFVLLAYLVPWKYRSSPDQAKVAAFDRISAAFVLACCGFLLISIVLNTLWMSMPSQAAARLSGAIQQEYRTNSMPGPGNPLVRIAGSAGVPLASLPPSLDESKLLVAYGSPTEGYIGVTLKQAMTSAVPPLENFNQTMLTFMVLLGLIALAAQGLGGVLLK